MSAAPSSSSVRARAASKATSERSAGTGRSGAGDRAPPPRSARGPRREDRCAPRRNPRRRPGGARRSAAPCTPCPRARGARAWPGRTPAGRARPRGWRTGRSSPAAPPTSRSGARPGRAGWPRSACGTARRADRRRPPWAAGGRAGGICGRACPHPGQIGLDLVEQSRAVAGRLVADVVDQAGEPVQGQQMAAQRGAAGRGWPPRSSHARPGSSPPGRRAQREPRSDRGRQRRRRRRGRGPKRRSACLLLGRERGRAPSPGTPAGTGDS